MAVGKTMAVGLCCCSGNDEMEKVELAQAGVTLFTVFSQKVAQPNDEEDCFCVNGCQVEVG